jgi:hypothetical protein
MYCLIQRGQETPVIYPILTPNEHRHKMRNFYNRLREVVVDIILFCLSVLYANNYYELSNLELMPSTTEVLLDNANPSTRLDTPSSQLEERADRTLRASRNQGAAGIHGTDRERTGALNFDFYLRALRGRRMCFASLSRCLHVHVSLQVVRMHVSLTD